jgi:hypothetical protein
MVIPFKSLRYRSEGGAATWGVNFRRVVRWKNETQFLTRIPASASRRGLYQLSSAATLVGLEPPGGRTFELKPYGITRQTTDRSATSSTSKLKGNGGFDAKVGLTEGLTGDLTYNTDFAQVEEDTQQVNLTRFTVQFPEKRDFFLEGQGIFYFGGISTNRFLPTNPNPDDVPLLFFSRRIGLSSAGEVPIDVGGRVTGKAGPYSIGLLDIRSGDSQSAGVAATNFGVVRVRRDILKRSFIGVIATDRSLSSFGTGHSRAYGVDGVFSFYQNLNINTYFAKTDNPGASGRDVSYRAQLDYNADRYGLQLERLAAYDRFDPDVGFMRRRDFIRNSTFLRFSPRPRSLAAVRKFSAELSYDYITDSHGRAQSKHAKGTFRTELANGDMFYVEGMTLFERIDQPFDVDGRATIAPGSYNFPELHAQYYFGPQRKVSGFITIERGEFYDGTRTGIRAERGRLEITPQVLIEPGVTVNRIDLPGGRFTQTLLTTRTNYTLTPRVSTSALIQYNSGSRSVNTNVRFRWEYQPGSDLFVVYSDSRDTAAGGFPALRNRGVVVKFTRLFRM